MVQVTLTLVNERFFQYTIDDYYSWRSYRMGLPSKRRTKQQKRERASHFALVETGLTACSHCKKRILPHHICPHCGYYRGRQVIKKDLFSKKKGKERGKKEKEEAADKEKK